MYSVNTSMKNSKTKKTLIAPLVQEKYRKAEMLSYFYLQI